MEKDMIARDTIRACRRIEAGLLALLLIVVPACTDYTTINTPHDRITAENVDASLLGQAFGKAQFSGMAAEHQPTQTFYSHYGDIYSQYFAQTQANFDSDQLHSLGRRPNYIWERFYTHAAPQLKFVEDLTAANDMRLENAVAKVWKANLYTRMSDYFGPIIYSQFGNGQTSVGYDSQESIYNDAFAILEEAVTVLQQSPGGNAFGQHDLIYAGNVERWRRFANSLRLRLAMRISGVDPARARQIAEAAVTSGVITNNADNAKIAVNALSFNGYVRITDWAEFRMGAAMESALKGYNDPRLEVYFDEAVTEGRGYRGLRNGLPRVLKPGTLNRDYSDMNIQWRAPGFPGPPYEVLRAAEVYFLRAEGALRGWNMGGTPQQLYEEGIRMSMQEYTTATAAEVEAYIAGTSTPIALDDPWDSPPVADIPVRFDPQGSFERQLEQIITQKWLALYPDGHEAWAERRRTGYPVGYTVLNTLNPDLGVRDLFRRAQFTEDEYSANSAAVQDALQLIGGRDGNDVRLWWDVKPLSEYPVPRGSPL